MSNGTNETDRTHDDFTPDPEEAEYPAILRITALPEEEAKQTAIERAERWDRGEDVPHVVNFEDRAGLRRLLTTRRRRSSSR